MSRSNTKQQNQYDANIAWPRYNPTSAEDCLRQLIKLSYSGRAIECHGASQDWECICSTLDVRFKEKQIPKKHRMTKETSLLETFAKESDEHFSSGDRRLIGVARLKWKTFRNTGTVFVGRHYGLPTRCVDWTTDPLIALFFACRRDFDKPGVVWWMVYNHFSDAISTQWQTAYGKNERIEDDFERDFVDCKEKDILIRFHYADWMERPKKQKAHVILSGQYNVHHDEEIYRLGVQECRRFIIGPQMKLDLLKKLNLWGINDETLGIGEIGDSCVEKIAADISDKFFGM
jgi:hypothetical protein